MNRRDRRRLIKRARELGCGFPECAGLPVYVVVINGGPQFQSVCEQHAYMLDGVKFTGIEAW